MSKKVLFTLAGNTDPTRGQYDGPIIHICRYHKPEKIYLLLTSEMEKRDSEPYNIYERAIHANLHGYQPEIIRIKTNITEAHKFENYFDVVHNTFEQIKQENPDVEEVLVNITSGAPQSTANLITYIVDATDLRIRPVQVSTPAGKSNDEKTVDEHYDVELEAETNLDNDPNGTKNRLIQPDLTYYSRILLKNQIRKLLEKYQYEACAELLRKNVFKENQTLMTLINYANDRKHLKGLNANQKLRALDNSKYDQFYYYTKHKQATKVERWYEIIDYFALAIAKEQSDDITGYTLMMEPITVNLYQIILQDLMNIRLDQLFSTVKSSKSADITYKISPQKLEPALKSKIERDLAIPELRENHLSDKALVSVISYYLDKKTNTPLERSDFDTIVQSLEKIKPVRNMIAHSLTSVSRSDFKNETKIDPQKVNSEIMRFLDKYLSPKGYKKNMLHFYDNINEEILKLLEEEK